MTAQKKIRIFLKQRQRAFVLLGGLVIFATFIVKEAVKENLKDLMSAIDVAKESIDRIELHRELLREIGTVRDDVRGVENNLKALKLMHHPDTEAWRRAHWDDYEREVYDLMQSREPESSPSSTIFMWSILRLAETRSLIRSMGKERDYQNDLKAFDLRMDEIEKCRSTTYHQEEEEFPCRFMTLKASGDMSEFESKVLRTAYAKQERNGRWYRVCTRVSYILYGIGWTMALVGRLYGIGSVE